MYDYPLNGRRVKSPARGAKSSSGSTSWFDKLTTLSIVEELTILSERSESKERMRCNYNRR